MCFNDLCIVNIGAIRPSNKVTSVHIYRCNKVTMACLIIITFYIQLFILLYSCIQEWMEGVRQGLLECRVAKYLLCFFVGCFTLSESFILCWLAYSPIGEEVVVIVLLDFCFYASWHSQWNGHKIYILYMILILTSVVYCWTDLYDISTVYMS